MVDIQHVGCISSSLADSNLHCSIKRVASTSDQMAALGGLSDQAAEKQLTQMIDFIKLEAREKAEEIRAQV